MDWYLMAIMPAQLGASLAGLGNLLWTIFAVACGIGFVIFVHELGHFLVAKMCGVKCEKFYIGFDVPIKIGPIALPSRLGRFQWGETEYGIGIIPLGGYVKMLGQDDDPRAAQAEAERIRIYKSQAEKEAAGEAAGGEIAGDPTPSDQGLGPHPSDSPFDDVGHLHGGKLDDEYELDPRSFPAKTVPQRMAIISAGVIMNVIFAVIFATLAFRLGVSYTPCLIGGTVPGSPAWRAGVEPGDRIIQLGSGETSDHLRFKWDLQQAVLLAGGSEDLPIVVQRQDGTDESLVLRPAVMEVEGSDDIPMIGVTPAFTTQLSDKEPVIPYLAAGKATPSFEGGDRIVAINDTSIQDGFQLVDMLARLASEPIRVTVERTGENGPEGESQRVEIPVEPTRLKRVGLILKAGPVSGVRPGSPADQAGFREGDEIETINGEPLGDPVTLPARIAALAGEETMVTVRRGESGSAETVELKVVPEVPTSYGYEVSPGVPLAIESLGLVMPLITTVQGVVPGSPAEQAELRAGDKLVKFQFTSDDPEIKPETLAFQGAETAFNESTLTWPLVLGALTLSEPGTDLRLIFERGGKQQSVTLKPFDSDQFIAERGLRLTSVTETYTAKSWTEAIALGFRQTKEDVYRVGTFLRKLVTGRIWVTKLGGPLSIAALAGSEASESLPRLLIFLTFLSANLAILNFLPIPALDGGHMVFLLAEWVRGKPVDERVQVALTLAGVLCLLTLMIFVTGMDIRRIFF